MNKRFVVSHGLVIKKQVLPNQTYLVTIFSKDHGKIFLSAYGIKNIINRRLSHFEVGCMLTFSYSIKDDYKTLKETELQYSHSGIKENMDRLQKLYTLFFVLNYILPDSEPEEEVYSMVVKFLQKLNKEDVPQDELSSLLTRIMLDLGYITIEDTQKAGFDIIQFIQSIIGRKVQ